MAATAKAVGARGHSATEARQTVVRDPRGTPRFFPWFRQRLPQTLRPQAPLSTKGGFSS
jgi:hypothetical protein